MTLIKSISGIRGTIGGKTGDNLTPIDAVKFAAAYGTFIKQNNPDKKKFITLFGYPEDPVLKKKWTKAIQATRAHFKEPEEKNCANSCVCSEHFKDDEFETPRNLLRELKKDGGLVDI